MNIVNTIARKALLVSFATAFVFSIFASGARAENCMHDGKEYSPGAVKEGKTCQRDGTWF